MNYEEEIKLIQVIGIETDKQAMAVMYMRENTITPLIDDLKAEIEKITLEQIQPLKNQVSKLDDKYKECNEKLLIYLQAKDNGKVYAPRINRMAYIKETESVVTDDISKVSIVFINRSLNKKMARTYKKRTGNYPNGVRCDIKESIVVCASSKEE